MVMAKDQEKEIQCIYLSPRGAKRNIEQCREFESSWKWLCSATRSLSTGINVKELFHGIKEREKIKEYQYLQSSLIPIVLQRWCYLRLRGLTAADAGKEISDLTNISLRTLQRWRTEFSEHGGKLFLPARGRYCRAFLTDNEELRNICVDYVRAAADPKGAPAMTANDFREFLNFKVLPK